MNQDNRDYQAKKVLEPEVIQPADNFKTGTNWQKRYQDQRGFSGVWIMPPVDRSGCLAPAISFILFVICLAQFGVLAGIGFLVFYTIGAIAGGIHASRRLMEGRPYNVSAWRIGNWIISFLLTIWLAGGFRD